MNGIILVDQWGMEEDKKEMARKVIDYLKERDFESIHLVLPFDDEGLSSLQEEFPEIVFYENPFYKNYNDIYSLSLVDLEPKDSYIIRLDRPINHNIFYEFDESRIFVTNKENIRPEICYEIDDTSHIIQRRKTTEFLFTPVGIYYIKGEDLSYLSELMGDFLGISSLRDDELCVEKLITDLQSKMELKIYSIPSSYLQ